LLILNDTKVLPANIIGRKEDGTAKIEVLLVSRKSDAVSQEQVWTCLVKPGKRLKVGSKIIFSQDLSGTVIEKLESGEQVVGFEGDLFGFMRENGEIPLPPYIKKNDSRKSNVENRYQTVYAQKEGASAAPTAGLHFTPELLDKIRDKGVKISKITLHTGLGTFKPVYAEYIRDHKMFEEEYDVGKETLKDINDAKRIIAVGTTSVRTLETIGKGLRDQGIKGSADIFIYPGYKFKVVDAMITNFHFPKTTLLMLVSAFAEKEFILKINIGSSVSAMRCLSFRVFQAKMKGKDNARLRPLAGRFP